MFVGISNTGRKWIPEFKAGRMNTKNEHRPYQPNSAATDESIRGKNLVTSEDQV